MNYVLSCVISNVAAPVLCISFVLPLLRILPANSVFARGVIMAICLSGNIAGMASPLASPQAAVAVGLLDDAGYEISFGAFMLNTLPSSVVLLIVSYIAVLVTMPPLSLSLSPSTPLMPDCIVSYIAVLVTMPPDIDTVPSICSPTKVKRETPQQLDVARRQMRAVKVITLVSVALWLASPIISDYVGPTSMISLIPVVLLFGTGLLDKSDIPKLRWSVTLLLFGGSVLGLAVKRSSLLDIVSESLSTLESLDLWVLVLVLSGVMTCVAAFISHTVSAILLLPIMIVVAENTGKVRLIVMLVTFMASNTSPLPVSSFPNISALQVERDGKGYLTPKDILFYGGGLTIVALIVDLSVGYFVGLGFGGLDD
ncbi:hypothetical protein KIPB_007032 [Kipferlia bialata]|uniref:Citrate transporter-like domain-containing protein n=1 Tax=Kipferlia bialata TaxID=797122 RepID=A0A9K3CYM8_9EUKA|nr:hypothetical protein KIPB_007032 [Kipferlia bialata]|eukprot:g7032.t1